MKQQISFAQYRTIDLTLLMGLLAISQFLIQLAVRFWFPEQLYVVSPVAAMVALVMMRWSGYAAIHAVLGGAVFVFLSGGTWQQLIIYAGGNLAGLLVLLMFRFFDKERIRGDMFLSLAFGFLVQLMMQLGRAALAFLFGNTPAACLGFITTDSLSTLFTLFIIGIVRQSDGLFEDQKHYLLRVQEPRDEGRDRF